VDYEWFFSNLLEPYRVDEDPKVTIPIDDIEQGIRDSAICLADITTNNPNIWYEVGFAVANGKAVVLICADPRPEPYPFDVRHRHIISYETQSSSDFDALREQITERLKAQAKKAEELQTAAAMSQIKSTEGLAPHEIGLLITIMASVSDPNEGISAYQIKESMKNSGFSPIACSMALASLQRKGMVEYAEQEDRSGSGSYQVIRVSQKGLEWLLENQEQFHMRVEPLLSEDEPSH
jgi:hypothetical protein